MRLTKRTVLNLKKVARGKRVKTHTSRGAAQKGRRKDYRGTAPG